MNNQVDLLNEIIELKKLYKETTTMHWYTFELGKWQWWLSLTMILLPLYIWWKIVDKRRIYEIISYGLLVNMITAFLDLVGNRFVLWIYPIRVVPLLPMLFPIDFVVVPVVYMIAYQRYKKWKQYIIANIVISFIFSFVAEPLLVWMNLYKTINWRYIYSFPIYVIIAITCKWLINWFGSKKPK